MSATNYLEKGPPYISETDKSSEKNEDVSPGDSAEIKYGSQALHRKLRGKEVQLFAIGGAIGTCENP